MAEPQLVPVDFDPFAGAQQDTGSGPLVVTAAPNRRQTEPKLVPVDHDPFAQAPSVAEDVAKSAGAGVARGAIGLLGLPGTVAQGLRWGADALADQTVGRAVNYAKTGSWDAPSPPSSTEAARQNTVFNLPTPDQVISGEKLVDAAATVVPGIKYQPQTIAGEYARTAGEFAPGALIPGSAAARIVGGVAAPAILSETAGQLTKGTGLEAPARVAGALAGGLGAAMLTRPGNANAAAAAHMTNVADADVLAAGRLMEEAASRGVPLTWPEAIAQTTGNSASLTSLQRVVEGSEKGGEVMRGFMSQRPAQMQAAGRAAMEDLAPPVIQPSTVGPQAGRAAQGVIDDGERAINRATRPLYAQAEVQRLDPADFARISQIPAFKQELAALRADPIMGPQFAQFGDDSVAVIDAIQKRVRDLGDAAKTGGEKFKASVIGGQRSDIINAADAAAPSYAAARQQQATLRERYLQPIIDGPLGKIAAKDTTTETAINALFPRKPLPGAAGEVADAVGALARKSPAVAERLVRAHAESVFDDATRALTGGANEFGAAKFSAALTGNAEQAASLEAAVRALPNGDVRWQGFRKFLDVAEATGQRQRIGSMTAFNKEIQDSLSKGGLLSDAVPVIKSGATVLPTMIRERYAQYQLGKNTQELARLITDPAALPVFRQLAKEAAGGAKAQAATLRLLALAQQGRAASER